MIFILYSQFLKGEVTFRIVDNALLQSHKLENNKKSDTKNYLDYFKNYSSYLKQIELKK